MDYVSLIQALRDVKYDGYLAMEIGFNPMVGGTYQQDGSRLESAHGGFPIKYVNGAETYYGFWSFWGLWLPDSALATMVSGGIAQNVIPDAVAATPIGASGAMVSPIDTMTSLDGPDRTPAAETDSTTYEWVAWLTGSVKGKARQKMLELAATGQAQLVSGAALQNALDQAAQTSSHTAFAMMGLTSIVVVPIRARGTSIEIILLALASTIRPTSLAATYALLAASESFVMAKAADGALLCAMRDVSKAPQVRFASERMLAANVGSAAVWCLTSQPCGVSAI